MRRRLPKAGEIIKRFQDARGRIESENRAALRGAAECRRSVEYATPVNQFTRATPIRSAKLCTTVSVFVAESTLNTVPAPALPPADVVP